MRPVDNAGHRLRLVVTGGIGSGKSTVVKLLEDLGAVVIEADRIGHAILEPQGAAFPAVAARWPESLVDGAIDRSALAAIVFNDPAQLAELEEISHPHIAAEISSRVRAAGDRDVVVELPVAGDLVGSDWTWIVVAAPGEVRRRRAVARGMSPQDVDNRMRVQPQDDEWLRHADFVIENAGLLDQLANDVQRVWLQLKNPSS